MADLFENPLGTDGFEFVEYTSPEPEKIEALFESLGFTAVAKHKTKNITRYNLVFPLNNECIFFLFNNEASIFKSTYGASTLVAMRVIC